MLTAAPSLLPTPLIEGRFVARLLDASNARIMEQAFALRHSYFVQKRRWVEEDCARPGLEIDAYDHCAQHLGVFDGDDLLAYVRLLTWREAHGFMLERDFRCLMTQTALDGIDRAAGCEISRLVLSPDVEPESVLPVTELLFKAVYTACCRNGIEGLYAVVEPSWLRRFARCFNLPFRPLGAVHRFPDGTRAVAAYASIFSLEAALQAAMAHKLEWYRQTD